MEFNTHPIPVFCPLDEIKERVSPELGDLNFVTRRATGFVRQLGYCGPGWQHRVQTEFLLHTGVICWDDISHVLTATAHHPAELLKRPLQIMESAWEEMDHAKRSVNSLIGLFCIDDGFAHRLVSSNDERDAPEGSLKSTFYYEGGFVTDYIVSTRLLTSASCRPLHDLCMCTEAVRVGQMIYALKQERATIYEFKTDSILYSPLKRRKKRTRWRPLPFGSSVV